MIDVEKGVPESSSSADRDLRKPVLITGIALLLGLGFEILFHGHPLGISFPVWVSACLMGLAWASWLEGTPPAPWTPLVILPILFFTVTVAIRLEPLTVFLAISSVLGLLALWIRTFRVGGWEDHGWLDYAAALVLVPLTAWLRPWGVLSDTQGEIFGPRGRKATVLAVARGMLLALPILILFVALLAAADLVFSAVVEEVLSWINWEVIAEYLGRTTLVLLVGLFSLGALVYALRDSEQTTHLGKDKPLFKPFLGFTEATVVLVAVDLVFLGFVIIQFAYLFGGQANITTAGYTYSEYARRGFGELVFVAFLSLGMVYTLASVTKRELPRQQSWFQGLSAFQVAMVGVMLISALRRLLLYENAYGFTRLRTYTHVAIFWIGLALAGFLVLLFTRRLRIFAGIAVVCSLGFAASLSLINLDRFIVQRNLTRFESSEDIDSYYLVTLSLDAVPELASFGARAPQQVRDELLPQLACVRAQLKKQQLGWPSTHASRVRAGAVLDRIEPALKAYFPYRDRYEVWRVLVQGESLDCWNQPWAFFRD